MRKGSKHRTDSIVEMRQAKTGKHAGKENPMHGQRHDHSVREKITQARQGTKWIHKGSTQRAVPLSDLEAYLNSGWSVGRITLRGRKWINDGRGRRKCVRNVIHYTYLGWMIGRD